MSVTGDAKENATLPATEVVELLSQQTPTDTSNWENKVSADPNGEKYIRTDDSSDIVSME